MSTSVIEPGTRLAGRYRLEKRIGDSGGSALWKAIDEILARAVAVRTFDPDFPRVHEVVTSARAASRLTDPRLTQVFDADDSGENAYVVSEWVAGETLEQMLAKAPLEPGRATTLLYEAAEAITAAHESDLAHLCLSPRDLVWTTGGTVKLLGVATDAVLGDRYSDDPAGQDVQGLGAMLYAALTAHWPGDPSRSSLPAAPSAGSGEPGGTAKPPRQVQAGVPLTVDSIVCRCLGIDVPGQEPLTDPAALATALRGVPRTPLPLFAGLNTHPPQRPDARTQRLPASRQQHAPPAPPARPRQVNRHERRTPAASPQRTVPDARPRRQARPATSGNNNRALLGIAAAALTVIVGLGAWALGDNGGNSSAGGGPSGDSRSSQPSQPQTGKLTVQNVEAAEDPIGGRHDDAIGERLGLITDGQTGAAWETQTYADVDFGRYAKALGVLLDMGRPVQVSSVKVNVPEGGGTLQLKIGDSRSPSALAVAGSQASTTGENTINPTAQATGRYVLVWFTRLPPSRKGKITEITVLGTPRS